jgi:starch phosphorylase
VDVALADRTVRCAVWTIDVGRVRLLLLDADLEANAAEDRALSHSLYGGDQRTRIGQEVLLGIGGVRALRALGLAPDVFHLNEGHCAFVTLELLREQQAKGLDRAAGWAAVRERCVFTTHTPVPAGHDRFDIRLVHEFLRPYRVALQMDLAELMDRGRVVEGSDETLCMTVVALKAARSTNGVARKHGEVSRQMWKGLWPDLAEVDVPIGHITNGVHAPSWLGPDISGLLDQYVPDWQHGLPDGTRFDAVDAIPDEALWAAHHRQKQRLLELVQERTGAVIHPDTLLLGFARRFATYKRGDLLLTDTDRARRLLCSADQPVQLLYAGKAHPRDDQGKEVIRRVLAATTDPVFEGRVGFLADYDMELGRLLTQGADVWINNPRRPREASGTSGEKVSMNGGLNCSTLDGWWIEGFELEPASGWAVGDAEPDSDLARGDAADAEALYSCLEDQVVPAFHDRDADGLPRLWIRRMKLCIAACLPAFNTDRMVADYVRQVYLG